MPKLKLTKDAIDALELPASGARGTTRQALYYDTEQPGLAVRVTSGGSRVYIAESWPQGRTVRVKLARVSDITLQQARQRARMVLGELAAGVNPNAQRRAERVRSLTLGEAFEDYVATRRAARRLSERTEYDYRRMLYGAVNKDGSRKMNGYLSPWRGLALSEISRDMVARRHAQLLERSGAQANYAMRMLSAVFNFARAKYRGAGDAPIAANPVEILRELKGWYRVERRTSVIRAHELKAWFAAVRALESPANYNFAPVARDYLQFLILTGLRRGEGLRLKWADVDLEARLFTVRDTKNGTDHTLPLSDYLVELLAQRQLSAARADLTREQRRYVFPGASKQGYFAEPKKMIARAVNASGIVFTPHDLRRTFISVAESLDIPAYALKRLLNHKMRNDVTAGYIVTDVERLRGPMQKITDFMLRAAGLRGSAQVIEASAFTSQKSLASA